MSRTQLNISRLSPFQTEHSTAVTKKRQEALNFNNRVATVCLNPARKYWKKPLCKKLKQADDYVNHFFAVSMLLENAIIYFV